MTNNIFFNSDSYKIGMFAMYPENITEVYSFIESRGGMFKEVVVSGVNQFISDYLVNPMSDSDIDDLVSFFKLRPEPFNEENFRRVISYNGGYLPLEIKALPEGTVVPNGVPMVTIKNTIPEAYWLTTMMETVILSYVWSMSSVATITRELKKVLKKWNDKTSAGFAGIDFQMHNFGDRGAKPGFAKYAGNAHLINFMGTDSIIGTKYVLDNYDEKDRVFGYSVPASEHSISTAWGPDKEKEYVLNMINKFKDNFDIISIVADTYDIFKFTNMIVTDKDIVESVKELAKMGKKIVIRPDSGDPINVLPVMFDILSNTHGYTKNDQGYKVLNPGIGVLWGDGITIETVDNILKTMSDLGWASQNLVFGCGGYITDFMGRDDLKFAMKASNIVIDGKSIPIGKDPVTAAWKKSKKGKFSVVMNTDWKLTWRSGENLIGDKLETVYVNGWFKGFGSFQDVKNRAK